tara:strand:+ start:1986 stop:2291 length:306 start_codon:yes stop_codon:yes gene_type:complete
MSLLSSIVIIDSNALWRFKNDLNSSSVTDKSVVVTGSIRIIFHLSGRALLISSDRSSDEFTELTTVLILIFIFKFLRLIRSIKLSTSSMVKHFPLLSIRPI